MSDEMPELCDEEEQTMPELCDDDDENNEEDFEDLIEFNETPCQDLFSEKKFSSARECVHYCKDVHGFDIEVLAKRFSLDCFSFIRMINYIRSEKPSPGLVMSLASPDLWKDNKFMKPTIEDDPLLMYDIELDENNLDNSEFDQSCRSFADQSDFKDGEEDEMVIELRKTVDILKVKLAEKESEMERLLTDMDRMKLVTQSLVESGDKKMETEQQIRSVSDVRTEAEDSYYAGSYSHFGIHHEMLSDRCRTEAYRDAIQLNSKQISGKTVLDLGCGTGILSMFCADLGKASRVIGVDMSEALHFAMDIVRENGMEEKITLLKGRLEDLNLAPHIPQESSGKVDVLVSEWMGYFLLFEGMLDSVLYARDKYLVKGGLILPNRCTMHLVGVSDEERYEESVDYWKNVYGYKMSCMKKPSISEATVEIVPSSTLITTAAQIHHLDVNTCTLKDTEFETEFTLKVESSGNLTSVAGYFDSFFDDASLENKVVLPTGPQVKPTHWKQTVFYLEEKFAVVKDQVLQGCIKVERSPTNVRGLRVLLTINGKAQSYSID